METSGYPVKMITEEISWDINLRSMMASDVRFEKIIGRELEPPEKIALMMDLHI